MIKALWSLLCMFSKSKPHALSFKQSHTCSYGWESLVNEYRSRKHLQVRQSEHLNINQTATEIPSSLQILPVAQPHSSSLPFVL